MPIKISPIEITNEEIGAVKQKAPDKLPDRPTDAGWGAARIKAFLAGVLIDDKDSLLSLLKSIVKQANERLDSIIEQADDTDATTDKTLKTLRSEFDRLDSTIYPWARQAQKPQYTCAEIGAMSEDTFVPSKTSDLQNDGNGESSFSTHDELVARIIEHGSDTQTHGDIRVKLDYISARLAAVLNSDDTTLDELSEIVAYIKNNKELIDSITTNKVSVSDIIDNLSTNMSDKPLSAAQGVVLEGLIAKLSTRFDDFIYAGGEADPTVPDWAKEDNKPIYTAEEVGALPKEHNSDGNSHADIRNKLEEISERLVAVLDSDDTTLDELSEIVAYIKENKELIDAITINKLGPSDVIDDLLTSAANKPLSANQGVVLKALIDSSLYSNHFGTTAGTICQGNDSRLSNTRTPKSHASSYSTYGLSTSSLYGHAKASSTLPKANGTPDTGSNQNEFARGDHVHPHDYPVGFLFVSKESTSPTDRGIAGIWEAIPEGHTIVGAGGEYIAESIGGVATVSLTVDQIPSHRHGQKIAPSGGGWAQPMLSYSTATSTGVGVTGSTKNVSTSNAEVTTTQYVGGGESHDNMPPYVAYYAWIRIA